MLPPKLGGMICSPPFARLLSPAEKWPRQQAGQRQHHTSATVTITAVVVRGMNAWSAILLAVGDGMTLLEAAAL
jgi:hypothetical protein